MEKECPECGYKWDWNPRNRPKDEFTGLRAIQCPICRHAWKTAVPKTTIVIDEPKPGEVRVRYEPTDK
jgi:hypothetical protein